MACFSDVMKKKLYQNKNLVSITENDEEDTELQIVHYLVIILSIPLNAVMILL